MFTREQLYEICLAEFAAIKTDRIKYDWSNYIPEKLFKDQLEDIDRETFDNDINKTTSDLLQEFKYLYDYKNDEKEVEKYKEEMYNKISSRLKQYLIISM